MADTVGEHGELGFVREGPAKGGNSHFRASGNSWTSGCLFHKRL